MTWQKYKEREVHLQNEDGTVSSEIRGAYLWFKIKRTRKNESVSIHATVPLKEFDYNTEVEIINTVTDTVANATFQGVDVDWYIKADEIVLKNKHSLSNGNNKPVDV